MAARQAPQLRVFRNDFARSVRALAAPAHRHDEQPRRDRRARHASRPTACGRPKIVQAGSGFLSQHSKELLVRARRERARRRADSRRGPRAARRSFTDVPLNVARIASSKAATSETRAASPRAPPRQPAPTRRPRAAGRRRRTRPGSTSRSRRPSSRSRTSRGTTRSLAALRGNPAVLLLWSPAVAAAAHARSTRWRAGARRSTQAGVGSLAIALDDRGPGARGRAAAVAGGRAGRAATREVSAELRDPQPAPVHEPAGPALPTRCCSTRGQHRQGLPRRVDVAQIVAGRGGDRGDAGRAAGAGPAVPGAFYSPLPLRNFLPYGRELLDQGLEAAAVVAFERAAQANPSASTLYRLGTLLAKSGETAARAGGLRARARAAARPGRSQQRSRRAAGAGRRPRRRDRAVPGGARGDARVSRCAQQPRLCAAADRPRRGGAARCTRGRSRCSPISPKRSTTSGCCSGRAATWTGRSGTSASALAAAPTTARPPTTWRWCWSREGRPTRRSSCSRTC